MESGCLAHGARPDRHARPPVYHRPQAGTLAAPAVKGPGQNVSASSKAS